MVVDDDPNIIIPERWFYILVEVALRLDNPSIASFVHQVVLKLLATFGQTVFAKEKLTNLVNFFASTYEFARSKTSMVSRTVPTPITSIATPTPPSVITPLPPPPTKPIHNPIAIMSSLSHTKTSLIPPPKLVPPPPVLSTAGARPQVSFSIPDSDFYSNRHKNYNMENQYTKPAKSLISFPPPTFIDPLVSIFEKIGNAFLTT